MMWRPVTMVTRGKRNALQIQNKTKYSQLSVRINIDLLNIEFGADLPHPKRQISMLEISGIVSDAVSCSCIVELPCRVPLRKIHIRGWSQSKTREGG